MSDRLGSRRRTLQWLMVGVAIGYGLMGMLNGSWSLAIAVAVVMACSFCVQASEGAVHAIVPLVHKPVTGQIAGMVGAYGTAGAVCYLAFFSVVPSAETLFWTISAMALFGAATVFFLDDPKE